MANTLLSFGTSVLRAGLPTVLGMLRLSASAQAPAGSAFDILEVGRWSNPPTKINPLAAHRTYHSGATNADNIRGRLAIKIVIGSEDGLLEWSEKLHDSMVKLKISHELEIVGGAGHNFGPKGIYEHQLRALRYAADHFGQPQPVLGASK